ncbi:MAG: 30S ribosomal protein S20 [candidate division WS6 bacterium GW2011_GWA2_37_6]|uniref:Small ribosomal subunit protein bS20 n=1 Tax=candidate division WS6 bacterium GW2011_GWA2_37_6 TaxID=1619087 RepID=A0A0G0K336_9BACT|nr:MAG: 30S ribosomal protein S20 [candidate division WS6 bacterium GW2011_GWA2_37_6]
MANTKSAKKSIRVSKRKRTVNLSTLSAFKEARKKVLDLIKEGEIKAAEKALPAAYKAIDKAAKNNTIHKKTAARYKSRLASKLNKPVAKVAKVAKTAKKTK